MSKLPPSAAAAGHWLQRLVTVEPREAGALIAAFFYFYLLLCAYYIIRPIRDEMLIANGVDNIQWLLLLTMGVLLAITPAFGWVTSRFRTRQFLSYCTLFFALHLVAFYFLFGSENRSIGVTRAFFVWVNVFNMFIVSLFWSFMNDIFTQAQAKRLFAFIAAGGTAGALTGPVITTSLVQEVGLGALLLISACVLTSTVVCIGWLTRWHNPDSVTVEAAPAGEHAGEALDGSIWGGFTLILQSRYLQGICAFIVLYAISITFVQIQQAQMIEATYTDPTQRTKLFSQIDFAANALTLIFQAFITSRLITWIGYRATLLLIPVGITVGFAVMAFSPLLAIMVGVEIFRRSGDYAIMKPAREMLFSVVSREEKYKAKNFIDTAVLRTGNTSSAWLFAGIRALGAGSATIGGISLALGVAWCAVAYWVAGRFTTLSPHRKTGEILPRV